jgi:NAD(P)-dependent dehydrogenase (short-subunit alcohol dehydrogenase family)
MPVKTERIHTVDRFSLRGQTSIVTGAAGGLGRALALGLAEAGSNVVVADVNLTGATETAALLLDLGVRSSAHICDIADRTGVQTLASQVLREYGRVDVLLNNAGVFQDGPAEDMDYEQDWRRVMDTNVDGTFHMCQVFGRAMIAQGGGCIINIASKSGLTVDYPNKQAAYNTSKAAIIMLTRSLAVEWASRNVRVNCICPGNFVAHADNPVLQPGHPYREAWMRNTPAGRFGQPHELVTVALYLASPASSFTTGAVEVVDGGFTII